MTYTKKNGIRYPDLTMKTPTMPLGKYGMMRRRYLEESDPAQLNTMMLDGTLNTHLAEMDRQAHEMVEQTLAVLAARANLPDKQTDPLGWAAGMNSLRQQAEESARGLIYSN